MSTEAITPSELLVDARIRALWTPRQAAERLQVSLGTLASWRSEGRKSRRKKFLPYITVGGQIRYEPEAVEAYLKGQTADGTNEPECWLKAGPGRPKKTSAKRKRK